MTWCKSITDFSPIENLTNLSILNLDSIHSLTNLNHIGKLTNLEELHLNSCQSLENIESFKTSQS
ncbi:MAG: hypothetical protein H7A23_08995 [Leptospiraceae bacterium]|nr:hypothetical protein [Leptospiraceae bacterium]MCP5494679.1 hypothetical protein [Leptospiraceae bacterium]